MYWTDDGYVLSMDSAGKALWRCAARSEKDKTKTHRIVDGDWNGDGVKEWAVPGTHEILIVSAAGKVLCHTGIYDAVTALLCVPGKPGLFITGNEKEITAYAPAGE